MDDLVGNKLGWTFLSWTLVLQTLHSNCGEWILPIFRGALRPLVTCECHCNAPPPLWSSAVTSRGPRFSFLRWWDWTGGIGELREGSFLVTIPFTVHFAGHVKNSHQEILTWNPSFPSYLSAGSSFNPEDLFCVYIGVYYMVTLWALVGRLQLKVSHCI